MGGLGRQAVQACRLRARSRPVSPVLYPLGPETPEGPKGQRAPNTSGKPPAPPWVSPMGRGDPVLRKTAQSPMERQKPGTASDQGTQLRAPLSPPLPEPTLSTGMGIPKPCSPRRPEAEFRSRGSPLPALPYLQTPQQVSRGDPTSSTVVPPRKRDPWLFPVPGPAHSHF